jgi:hypothetical protein
MGKAAKKGVNKAQKTVKPGAKASGWSPVTLQKISNVQYDCLEGTPLAAGDQVEILWGNGQRTTHSVQLWNSRPGFVYAYVEGSNRGSNIQVRLFHIAKGQLRRVS